MGEDKPRRGKKQDREIAEKGRIIIQKGRITQILPLISNIGVCLDALFLPLYS